MKQKSMAKRAFIYSATTVLVLFCAFMISRSVRADVVKLRWAEVSNNTVEVTIDKVDTDTFTLRGEVDGTVDKVQWSYNSIPADQLDNDGNGVDLTDKSNISVDVSLRTLNPDTNGKDVYFYVHSTRK